MPPIAHSLHVAVRVLLGLGALALIGCGTSTAVCASIPFASAAAEDYAAETASLAFEPPVPCAYRSDLKVARVLGGVAAAIPPEPRISFVVERRTERAFVLSATRAELPFRAIPRNAEHLRAGAGPVTAAGFAGPSGGGDDIAYLRWRTEGVTYELAATLHPWLTRADVQAITAAMIARTTTRATASP